MSRKGFSLCRGIAMSSLIVEVCRVEEVRPHPNADRMAIARVKGWKHASFAMRMGPLSLTRAISAFFSLPIAFCRRIFPIGSA